MKTAGPGFVGTRLAARMGAVVAVVFLALVGSSLAVQPATAAGHTVQSAAVDLFIDVPATELELETGCNGGAFEVDPDGTWIRYVENDDVGPLSPTAPDSPPGYFDTGCGTARVTVDVPAGLEHMHVRFEADRGVEELQADEGAPVQPNPPGLHFVQDLQILHPTGEVLFAHPVHAPGDPAAEMEFHDPPAFILPPELQEVTVAWYYEDTGLGIDQDPFNVASGEAYNSTLQAIRIEFSGVPVPTEAFEDQRRSGSLRIHEEGVRFHVPEAMVEAYDVSLRVRSAPTHEFAYVVTPDGARLDSSGTRFDDGPPGYDPDLVLVENWGGTYQVTVPWGIVAEHGAGDYEVVLQQVEPVRTVPTLVPLVAVLLAVPFPFSILAIRAARIFEAEAFSLFRRAARNLILAVVVTFLYYLAVVLSALTGGRLELMTSWPAPLESVLLYIQIVVAAAAFFVLWRTAHNLYKISRPAPATES